MCVCVSVWPDGCMTRCAYDYVCVCVCVCVCVELLSLRPLRLLQDIVICAILNEITHVCTQTHTTSQYVCLPPLTVLYIDTQCRQSDTHIHTIRHTHTHSQTHTYSQ